MFAASSAGDVSGLQLGDCTISWSLHDNHCAHLYAMDSKCLSC